MSVAVLMARLIVTPGRDTARSGGRSTIRRGGPADHHRVAPGLASTIRTASSGVMMSPFPITGILHRAFTAAILDQPDRPRSPATSADAKRMFADRCNPPPCAPSRSLPRSSSFSHAKLARKRDGDRLPYRSQQRLDQRKIAQQSRAAIAFDHLIHRAAERCRGCRIPVLANAVAMVSGSAPNNRAEIGCSSG